MIKITNGKNVFEVTRGAFDGIFSRQGYTVVCEKTEVDQVETVESAPEKTEDEKFVDEMVEKPISQWTKEEVKRFAAIKEIDLTGTKNAGEAKELIKQFMNKDSE